jgi:hypothetical protein
MWSAGTDNQIIGGTVRTFEFDQGLTMDGDAGAQVWSHLFAAIAKGEQNQHGYAYVCDAGRHRDPGPVPQRPAGDDLAG